MSGKFSGFWRKNLDIVFDFALYVSTKTFWVVFSYWSFLKHIGTVRQKPSTSFQFFSCKIVQLLCAFSYEHFWGRKNFLKEIFSASFLEIEQAKIFGLLAKKFSAVCQKCVLLVHRNNLRKNIFFSEKVMNLYPFGTIKEKAAFCQQFFGELPYLHCNWP